MTTFRFRLRFNFPESYRIASGATELLLLTDGDIELKLKSGLPDSPLEKASRAAIIGGPFTSADQAHEVGEQAKRSVLFWAVEQRVGVDFGDGKQRSHLTADGMRAFEEQYGRPIRLDRHGIDVYETRDNLGFLNIGFEAGIQKNPQAFVDTFQREFPAKRHITEKQMLASEIYASSFFDVSQRSRFITLVTAVEALLDSSKRDEDVQTLVDEFVHLTKESGIDCSIRKSICGSLNWIRYESIGRTGRTLVNQLLPGQAYAGMPASQFFAKAYSLRSTIVHTGAPEDGVDMLEMANAMEEFVARLVLASLGSTPECLASLHCRQSKT